MEPVRIKVSIEVTHDGIYSYEQKSVGSATMETRAQLTSIDHASGEMRRLVERTLEEVERQIGITKQVQALEEQKRVRVEIEAKPASDFAGEPREPLKDGTGCDV